MIDTVSKHHTGKAKINALTKEQKFKIIKLYFCRLAENLLNGYRIITPEFTLSVAQIPIIPNSEKKVINPELYGPADKKIIAKFIGNKYQSLRKCVFYKRFQKAVNDEAVAGKQYEVKQWEQEDL